MVIDINKRRQDTFIREENMRIIMIWLLRNGFATSATAYQEAEENYDDLAGELSETYFYKNGKLCRRFAHSLLIENLLESKKRLL